MISKKLKDELDFIKQFVPKANHDFKTSNADALEFLIKEFVKSKTTFAVKEFSIEYPITKPTTIVTS